MKSGEPKSGTCPGNIGNNKKQRKSSGKSLNFFPVNPYPGLFNQTIIFLSLITMIRILPLVLLN